MTTTDASRDWVATASALRGTLEAQAEASQDSRTATKEAVEALRDSGLFTMLIPRALGGPEVDLATFTDALAELSYADGSLGWTVLANATNTAFAAAFLGDDAVADIFGAGPVEVAAQLSPRGTITRADGGWTLGGRYSFGSGSGHAAWIGAGAIEMTDGRPVMQPSGIPSIRGCYVPRAQVDFKDGWHVMGLEGTGSYDYDITDQQVPDDYTFALLGPPQRGGPIYRLRVPVIGTAGHAGWALGAARRALDEALAAAGRPFMRGLTPVGQMEGYLTELGALDGALRSARSYVLDVFAEAEAFIEHADTLPEALAARVQQAITQCTRVAVDVVRKSFEWSGVAAIRDGVLERTFRDVHVAAQHVTQTRASFANVTRVAIAG
jgi:alkylation response protein AidB-like acyl-CoA dehydrogenase